MSKQSKVKKTERHRKREQVGLWKCSGLKKFALKPSPIILECKDTQEANSWLQSGYRLLNLRIVHLANGSECPLFILMRD